MTSPTSFHEGALTARGPLEEVCLATTVCRAYHHRPDEGDHDDERPDTRERPAPEATVVQGAASRLGEVEHAVELGLVVVR